MYLDLVLVLQLRPLRVKQASVQWLEDGTATNHGVWQDGLWLLDAGHLPTCPTWDMSRWAMDNYVLTAHPELRMQGQGHGGGVSSRQERLPRPTLDTGITEADWTFFESQWERYKRSTRLLGQDATDQLWACASDKLSRQAHDARANKNTSQADLITMFKLCSVRTQNRLVNIVASRTARYRSESLPLPRPRRPWHWSESPSSFTLRRLGVNPGSSPTSCISILSWSTSIKYEYHYSVLTIWMVE